MAQETVKAIRPGVLARFDRQSPLFLAAGIAVVALILWIVSLRYPSMSQFGRIAQDKVDYYLTFAFFVVLFLFLGLYAYRLMRMADPRWRREYKRTAAPKLREFRHTLHLLRKSLLTLVGIVIIAAFIVVAILAKVAPGLVAPSPEDGGAIVYRGELFQPPFQYTLATRNETFETVEVNATWTTPQFMREAEPPYFFPLVAESSVAGDTFVVSGFRLGDVYTDDIRALAIHVRGRFPAGNALAVSVSPDGGQTWLGPFSANASVGSEEWANHLDFLSLRDWKNEDLQPGVLKVRGEHVVDPSAPVGPVQVDYFGVSVTFQGRYVLFGTDDLGRDYLSRVVLAAPYDLEIAILVVGIALLVGVVLGVVAGYFGGWVDEMIMRITDIFLSVPGLILALAFTSALGPGLDNVMTALIIVWWPPYTRLIRGQALAVRENLYVEAARAVGVPSRRIVFRHILPNTFAPVLVNATLDMGSVILVASALSFLGLGVRPPAPEWGAMVSDGRNYIIAQGWWWLSTFPGLAILFASLGFNLAGDGLRDILDPRLRR